MKKKHALIALLCLLITACEPKNYDESYEMMASEQAESAEHQYRTGMRYLLGQGTHVDYEEARIWLERAAAYNNPYAENELGYIYLSGLGVDRDYQRAFEWYQRAARHGLASAQYNLGMMYLKGLGTSIDKAKAKEWLERAAVNGFAPANNALARLSHA